MKTIALENNIQKSFLAMSIVLIVVGLVLHNPLSGYSIPSEMSTAAPCSDNERAAYRRQFEELKRSGIKLTDDPTRDSAYIEKSVCGMCQFTVGSVWTFERVEIILSFYMVVRKRLKSAYLFRFCHCYRCLWNIHL